MAVTDQPVVDSTVPIEYVQSLLATAKEQGCNIEQLLENVDINPSSLTDSRVFSAIKYGQLYQQVMWLTQDECFGMMMGGKVQLGSFRLLCLTVIQCDNLREAIIRSSQFSEICRGFRIKAILHEQPNNVVRASMQGISSLPENEFIELMSETNADKIRTSLAVWHRFNCWLIGEEIPLLSISLSFPCPDAFTSLAESSPTKMLFNQNYNGYEFDSKYLDAKIIQNRNTLEDFIRTAPYHLVIRDSAQSSMKTKVRTILSKDVSQTMPTTDQTAQQLNIAVATLRRRLQQENTSFQKIKDECRLEAAIHYLGCAELSNNAIAERLGFDEPSAFFRAFKKWTGLTPGEYRQQL